MPVFGVRANVGPAPQGLKIDFVSPGSRGLNLEQAQSVLPMQWAIEAQNCVFDSNGRLGARKLFVNQTTTPIAGAPTVRTIFEQRRAAGTVDTIVAWDGGISNSVTNPSGSNLSGTVAVANGRWKFVNFNDKCIGFQSGQTLIVRTTGNFANVVVASGSAPTGGVGTAAYGRIWQLDADGNTIKYCALLDETKWATADGGGSINMQTIWTDGTDVVTAISTFNHNLVVFGRRHIVLFNQSGAGVLGLDPTKIQVSDMITGTGCLSQYSVAPIGDSDLFFLSPTGVQSLRRLLINRSNPLDQVTKYSRSALMAMVNTESASAITAVWSAANNFYLLALPASGYVWVLDTKRRFTDEFGDDCCVVTRWKTTLYALYETVARQLYVSRTAGKVAGYGIGTDTTEEPSCRYIWRSPWQDFAERYMQDRQKILKRIGGQFYIASGANVLFKWWTDFAPDNVYGTATVAAATTGAPAEFGIAEFAIGEFGGGLGQASLVYDARAVGQYYSFGAETDVSGGSFAIQQAHIFAKVGRLLA